MLETCNDFFLNITCMKEIGTAVLWPKLYRRAVMWHQALFPEVDLVHPDYPFEMFYIC